MHAHPDADAFVRAILRDPADVATRLVFADWLEETGEPPNVAWAHFIRLNAEADGHAEREELELQAGAYRWQIEAKLMIPAAVFVRDSKSLLQLLPPWALTVKLGSFEIARAVIELVPESVSRENVLLPLDLRGNLLLIASTDPGSCDTIQKLQFILNKDVVAVAAAQHDVVAAINRHYGQSDTYSVDCVSYESPLVGLEGDDTSGEVFGIFHSTFSGNCSGFEMERVGAACVIRFIARADPVPDQQHSLRAFALLLDHFLSQPIDAEYSERGIRCLDFDIPLLSGRRFPATLERRPAECGNRWFRVRFRWDDAQ